MRRHDFDLTSFVTGAIFSVLALWVMISRSVQDLRDAAWLFPAILVTVGALIVGSIVRKLVEDQRAAEPLDNHGDEMHYVNADLGNVDDLADGAEPVDHELAYGAEPVDHELADGAELVDHDSNEK